MQSSNPAINKLLFNYFLTLQVLKLGLDVLAHGANEVTDVSTSWGCGKDPAFRWLPAGYKTT